MSLSMKLWVFLWLVMVMRVAGAIIAGRQCLRLRHLTKYLQLYEWLTAFGVGLMAWGLSDLGLIWNSIVNGPPNRDTYPSKTLWYSIAFQLVETGAVWLIALVMINGLTPGFIRQGIFWFLIKIHLMEIKTFEPTQLDRMEAAAGVVAVDLAEAHARADATIGEPGAAADAAAQLTPGLNRDIRTK